MPSVKILEGNCLDTLKTLEAKSINTVVTSPPYYNLRDYNGEEEQIGLEETPQEYIQSMVNVFKELKRVLRDDGTVWLNIGDTYHNKELLMIPHRLAIALADDGWLIRQDIIWSKGNPMPESVRDRCTKSHEYIFLITKNRKYYFDAEAIKEPTISDSNMKNKRSVWNVNSKAFKGAHFAVYPVELIEPCVLAGCPEVVCADCSKPYKRGKIIDRKLTQEEVDQIRNNLVVNNKEKKPYAIIEKEFRNQVIEYRDLPPHDIFKEYLKDNRNLTIKEIEDHFETQAPHHWFETGGSYPSVEDYLQLKELLNLDDTYDEAMTTVFYKSGLKGDHQYIPTEFTKQCRCITDDTRSGVVLDPFGGSGTTSIAAYQNNRDSILCELSSEYIEVAVERLESHGIEVE